MDKKMKITDEKKKVGATTTTLARVCPRCGAVMKVTTFDKDTTRIANPLVNLLIFLTPMFMIVWGITEAVKWAIVVALLAISSLVTGSLIKKGDNIWQCVDCKKIIPIKEAVSGRRKTEGRGRSRNRKRTTEDNAKQLSYPCQSVLPIIYVRKALKKVG